MKNLTEMEMVSVNGGLNWDAWSNGYNCLQCRDTGGQALGWAAIVAIIGGGSGGAGAALAALLASYLFGNALDQALYYCNLCIDDVRE